MANKNSKQGAPAASSDAAFKRAVDDARGYIEKARAALKAAGLVTLTDEERLHTNGRLRTDEPAAMLSVCDAMDASPGVFEALAPRDHGDDPEKVETGPTRSAIKRYETVAPLAAELAQLTREVGDDALAAASLAKEVTVPGYAILSANAPINKKLRDAGGKALNYYAGFGLRRAKQNKRAANQVKKAAKAAKTAAG